VLTTLFLAYLTFFVLMVGAAIFFAPLLRPVGVIFGVVASGLGLATATNFRGSAQFAADQAKRGRERWPRLMPAYTTRIWYPRLFGVFMAFVGLVFAYDAVYLADF
jgi:hypothetical protein